MGGTSGRGRDTRSETDRGGRRLARVAAALAVAAVLVAAGVAGATDHTGVQVDDASTQVDETTEVQVVLAAAPDGLAGFNLTVSVADSAVASVEGATVPDRFAPTETQVGDAERSVRVEAADIEERVQSGAEDVVLATVTIRGESDGISDLEVDVLRMDDDSGDPVEPATTAGRLTVTRPATTTTTTRTATTTTATTSPPTETTTTAATTTRTTATETATTSPPTATTTTTAMTTAPATSSTAATTATTTATGTTTDDAPPATTTSGDGGPGFGLVLTLVATVAAALLARRQA